MTRSVEIPDEKVEVAWLTITRLLAGRDANPSSVYRSDVRAALEAAAPAGDGGLREALEAQAGIWDGYTSDNPDVAAGFELAAGKLRELLAAHPAAPAVPQPACLGDGICTNPHCPAHGVEWSAVPQPVDRSALAMVIWRALPGDVSMRDSQAAADAVLALLAGEQEQVEK